MSLTKIFVLLALSVYSIASNAQKFSLGLKAGVLGTYTNFPDQKDSLKAGVTPGFSFGGLIMFPMKHNYSFAAEGGFSRQGRKWEYTPNKDKWTSTYNFYDLSMALRKTFRLKIKQYVASNWFVSVGPNINYWISGKGKMVPYFGINQSYTVVFDQGQGNSYSKIHVNDENRWLFGINLGIGTTFTTLKNQKIITELRMTWGQTFLGKRHSESLGGTPGINDEMSLLCNLKTLNFSIGYIFDRDIQKGRLGKSTKKVK
jgi:hypothetical protein